MRLTTDVARLAIFIIIPILAAGCNDAPSVIGTDLVPGTDSIYSVTSLTSPLIAGSFTSPERVPLFNSENVLFGKTTDSEARLIIEFTNYTRLGAADSFEVISSDLVMYPQAYRYGDTSNLTMSLSSYELKQVWYPETTWDSVWAPDGSTSYYSTSDSKVSSFEKVLTDADTVVYVPFDVAATKRWIVVGSDTASTEDLFGLVLLPEASGSIRLFRNIQGSAQIMQLRVIYKHADSADADTTFLRSAVANFVNTPPTTDSTDLIVQGAHINRTAFKIKIDSLPAYSIILGSSFRVYVDESASKIGTLGRDEVLTLTYTNSNGSKYAFETRGDETGLFTFPNITTIAQLIRTDGGVGTIYIEPNGANRYERMNRLTLFNMQSDSLYRPYINIVYAISSVFP